MYLMLTLKLQVPHLCILEVQWCGVKLIASSANDLSFTYLILMPGCEEIRFLVKAHWECKNRFGALLHI